MYLHEVEYVDWALLLAGNECWMFIGFDDGWDVSSCCLHFFLM